MKLYNTFKVKNESLKLDTVKKKKIMISKNGIIINTRTILATI